MYHIDILTQRAAPRTGAPRPGIRLIHGPCAVLAALRRGDHLGPLMKVYTVLSRASRSPSHTHSTHHEISNPQTNATRVWAPSGANGPPLGRDLCVLYACMKRPCTAPHTCPYGQRGVSSNLWCCVFQSRAIWAGAISHTQRARLRSVPCAAAADQPLDRGNVLRL